jgi:hypothetical protein
MSRTVGSRTVRREPIATNCSIRGVNCKSRFAPLSTLLTVHPALPPFHRTYMPFTPDSGADGQRAVVSSLHYPRSGRTGYPGQRGGSTPFGRI